MQKMSNVRFGREIKCGLTTRLGAEPMNVPTLRLYNAPCVCVFWLQRHYPGQHAGHPVDSGTGRRALLRTGSQRQERREQDQPAGHLIGGE